MVKAVFTGNKQTISKNLNVPKNGFVQKKKNNKPKQTPVGKIALINGSKARNNKNVKQQNLQKQTSNLSPKSIQKDKDQSKKHNPNKDKQKGTPPQKELNKKKITLVEEKDDSDSEIDEDINEGIVLEDQSMVDESENCEDEEQSDDDESEEEKTVPNILGHSLADESDDDDDDYEAEEEEEMKSVRSKQGVKMFTGSKQLNSSSDSVKNSLDNSALEETLTDESIEENDDNLEEEEEEDGDEEDQTDDEDGDDYNEELEEEDSNQGEDEDESEDEDEGEDEDEQEEDDDEQEEDDEDEADEPALGLKALLDNTIANDDEDDEDFVESGENDEDDDISDEEDEEEEEDENNTLDNSQQNTNKEEKADTSIEKIKLDKRTIFVGNLPVDVKKGQLNKLFKKFGTIETIRLRGMVAKSLNVSKKVAAKTKNIHPKLKSVYAYILYDSEKSAKSALAMNGTMFEGNYLRVDIADTSEKKYDSKKSVFVGNLNFKLDDNKFREHFAQCGEIESVRIVKDSKTGVNRGIGFINFKTEDAATLALELDGTTLLNREIRVKPNYKANENNKQKHGKRSLSSDGEHNVATKKSKNNEAVAVSNATKRIKGKEQGGKKQTSPQQGKMFEGQKADASKKKKKNKLDKKKKVLAEKLAAKPKKPSN